MKLIRLVSAAVLAAFATGAGLRAQISITQGNPGYAQDFNNDYGTQTLSWTDNATIPGWYLDMNLAGTPASVVTQVTASGTSGGPIYLLAHGNNTANFALFARVTNTNGGDPGTTGAGYYFGLRLTNDTGGVISDFTLGYTGVQFYRSADINANTILTSYQVTAGGASTALNTGSWTDISGLTFTAPVVGPGSGSGATVNFNNTGNYVDFTGVNVTGLTWNPGEDLWLRWYVDNVPDTDQGVGIDNISFTAGTPMAVPEPSTVSLIAGLAALCAFAARRRFFNDAA